MNTTLISETTTSAPAFTETITFPLLMGLVAILLALLCLVLIGVLIWFRRNRAKSSVGDDYKDIFLTEPSHRDSHNSENSSNPATLARSQSRYYDAATQKKAVLIPETTSARKFSFSTQTNPTTQNEVYKSTRISRDVSSEESDEEESSPIPMRLNNQNNENNNNLTTSSNGGNNNNNNTTTSTTTTTVEPSAQSTAQIVQNLRTSVVNSAKLNKSTNNQPPPGFNPYLQPHQSMNSVDSREGLFIG